VAAEYGLTAVANQFFSFFSDLEPILSRQIAELQDLVIEYKQNGNITEANKIRVDIHHYETRKDQLTAIIQSANDRIDAIVNQDEIDVDKKSLIIQAIELSKNSPDFIKDANESKISIEDLSSAVQQKWNEASNARYKAVIEELANTYLTIRNKMPYTAFPRQGNIEPPDDEGSIVKNASKELMKINQECKPLVELKSDIAFDATGEKVKKVPQLMLELFWFPKIPPDKLIDLATEQGRKKWKKIAKKHKYSSYTKPRDNSLKAFIYVAINHIDLVTC